MPNNEIALVLPEPGPLALLEHDGQAARDCGRESLNPARNRGIVTRRAGVPSIGPP